MRSLSALTSMIMTMHPTPWCPTHISGMNVDPRIALLQLGCEVQNQMQWACS
jgi:hypothetical protein